MERHNKIFDWNSFLAELAVRFGAAQIDNAEGLLSKLTQTGTVLEYQEQFELLSERVSGFSPNYWRGGPCR